MIELSIMITGVASRVLICREQTLFIVKLLNRISKPIGQTLPGQPAWGRFYMAR